MQQTQMSRMSHTPSKSRVYLYLEIFPKSPLESVGFFDILRTTESLSPMTSKFNAMSSEEFRELLRVPIVSLFSWVCSFLEIPPYISVG